MSMTYEETGRTGQKRRTRSDLLTAARTLMARGITYAPDFLVNAGGVIQVSDELHGFDFARAKQRTAGIFDTTVSVLGAAAEQGISPAAAADQLAEARMAEVGSNRIWLPVR